MCTKISIFVKSYAHFFRCEASMRYSTFIQDTAFTQGNTAIHLWCTFKH